MFTLTARNLSREDPISEIKNAFCSSKGGLSNYGFNLRLLIGPKFADTAQVYRLQILADFLLANWP